MFAYQTAQAVTYQALSSCKNQYAPAKHTQPNWQRQFIDHHQLDAYTASCLSVFLFRWS
jgi:hypothetical protein